jgi:hypothetical protein
MEGGRSVGVAEFGGVSNCCMRYSICHTQAKKNTEEIDETMNMTRSQVVVTLTSTKNRTYLTR